MNKLRPIVLAITAVAALSVAYPAKANLITNPGFETGDFTGWSVTGDGPAFVAGTTDGIAPHSGSFQAGFGGGHELGNTITQNVATTLGASYVLDFWVAANVSGPVFVESINVFWGGSTVFSHLFSASFGYTEYTFTVTASSATTALQFYFFGDSPEDFFLLDDVSVNPAGVPDGGSTVSLLGCALLGVAVLRRKLGC